ncbi:aldo/keto reductase [Frankia sp. Ag45/Mut15]|uniref:Aldo/keto reductase n=1 Tax=Frankia umida TaxID=573489 RepID=A0ABT0K350_9ACTN|nr:aldo/keto reductase [Frankia umida]
MCYSPLAAGQLTGWRDTPRVLGRRRMGMMSPLPGPTLRAARAALDLVALDLVARAHGVSMAPVALAWLLAQPGVTSVIVGPSRLEQLEDNLGAASLVLTEEELRSLDAATQPEPIYPGTLDRALGALAERSSSWTKPRS